MQHHNSKKYSPDTNRANNTCSKYINNYNSRTDVTNKKFFKGIKRCDSYAIVTANVDHRIKKFFRYVARGDTRKVIRMLKSGFSVQGSDDEALQMSSVRGYAKIVTKLLEYGADVHACEGAALESAIYYDQTEIVEILLKNGGDVQQALRTAVAHGSSHMIAISLAYGADIYCDDETILKNLYNDFNEGLANVILPYCCEDVYHYFPADYIRRNVAPTKGANKA